MSTPVDTVDFDSRFDAIMAAMAEGFAQQQAEIVSLRKLLGKKGRSRNSASVGGDTPKRPQQAHVAFTAYAKDTWPEEYEAFCAEFGRTPKVLEGKSHCGGAVKFASIMRGTADEPGPHADEWETFRVEHAERLASAATEEPEEGSSSASSTSSGSKKSRPLSPDEKERRALVRKLDTRELDTEGSLEELRARLAEYEQAIQDEKDRKKQKREAKTAAKPAAKPAAKSTPAPSSLLARASSTAKPAPKPAAKPAAKSTPAKSTPKPAVKVVAKSGSLLAKASNSAAAKSMAEELEEAEEETEETEETAPAATPALVTKPFTFKKVKYQASPDGYLWLQATDGSRGEYAGKIGDDGKIDASAPNPFE